MLSGKVLILLIELYTKSLGLLDIKSYRNKPMRLFYTVAKSFPSFHQQQIYYYHVYRKNP